MNKLKNIVLVNDFDFINGGISQVAILTANYKAELQYNVIYFSAVSHPQNKHLSSKVKQYSTNQYDILSNPSRIRAFIEGIWNSKAAAAFQSLLSGLNPSETIIHLHGWIKALSPSIGKVLSASGFKVVCTLHDYFSICPNGGLYNYQKNEICKLKPLSLECICTNCDSRSYSQKLWRVTRQVVQKKLAHLPNGIEHFITVSQFSENLMRSHLPANAKVYQLSNPVNYSLAEPQQADVSARRLLVIGRLSLEKGIELACEAARRNKIHLTVIGDGEQKNVLKQKYPEVEFKGWLDPEMVFQEMLHATALIFPSIWYETQGLVVLEALSVGLPVIVSDKCAASDYVADGVNGYTFSSGNADDLSDKINELLRDANSTKQMSGNAFNNYWKQPFSVEQYMPQLINVYERITNESKVDGPTV